MSEINQNQKLGYIASLDGLRALSVIMVMFTHANFSLGKNGLVGVVAFFTLSGFLITTILLEEFQKNNKISLKAFYIRRTLRLFPALYMMLIAVAIYAWIYRSGLEQKQIFQDVIASALYVYNIAWAWGWCKVEILLYHMWSLGVEEQFYLLWPAVLILFLRFKKLRLLQILLPLFIIIVAGLKIMHSFPLIAGAIINESILIGCFGALLRWNKVLPYRSVTLIIGIVALLGLAVPGIAPIRHIPNNYYYIFSLFTIILILHMVDWQDSIISKLFSIPAVVFVGKISYSLYIWHLPVFRLFAYHSTLPPMVSFVGKFVVSFVLATASWMLVEKYTTAFGRRLSAKVISKQH